MPGEAVVGGSDSVVLGAGDLGLVRVGDGLFESGSVV